MLCVLITFSCGDDVDEAVGTWDLVEWTISGCSDESNNFSLAFGDNGCVGGQASEVCTNIQQIVNENGTFSINGSITNNGSVLIQASESGTWQRDAGVFKICDSSGDCSGSANIQINGDRVTVTDNINGCRSTQIFERI